MADKRYAGTSALSAIFSQIKAAINEKVTKVSGKDVVNVEVENLLCDEQTDGNYVLTAVVNSGVPTYNWGEGVPGGGSFTDITYEDWLLLTPQEQAAKDYYISDYPSSPLTAGIIGYDNTNSGMNADNVQEAVDELKGELNEVNSNLTAMSSYSVTPTKVGDWLGHDLYRKVVDVGNLPNSGVKLVASGLTNEKVVNIWGYAKNLDDDYMIPLPFISAVQTADRVELAYSEADHTVRLNTSIDLSTFSGIAVIEYYTTQ